MKYAFGVAITCSVLVVGCGESHSTDTDAGITFDATPAPDTGVTPEIDAGPPVTEGDVGEPCGAMGDCESFCIDEGDGFPDGYCTAPCDADNPCPTGSTCTPIGRGMSICLAECDPDAAMRSCRAGYGCADSFMLPGPVCLPGCTDDTDCPEGTMCDPAAGLGGECFDPGAAVGDECTESAQCPMDGFCLAEDFGGWPGGACVGFGCDPDSGTGCGDDAMCLRSGRGGGLCVRACDSGTDCREGYDCVASGEFPERTYCGPACTSSDQCSDGRVCNPGVGVCDVAFDPDELGVACSTDRTACSGGTCLTEFESGLPGSYCTYVGCDPSMADGSAGADGCPGDGVCLSVGDTAICLDGCTTDTDCRADYRCRPSDPAEASSPVACRPACETDDACANDGFECNVGTGLCRPAFDTADIGEPCTGPATCEGGACITEADEGWPAGTCAFPGCRLSGTGMAETCPTGTVCVDDETGDPTLGACIDACTVGTDTCRPSYGCVAEGGSATDGACRPACEAGDCGTGRTCNATTGLCE